MSEVTEEMKWPEVIEAAKDKFLEVKPDKMNFTSERAFAIQHLRSNDFLMRTAKDNPISLQSAMLNVAAVGLSLNPAKKQAYLVPRQGKVCFDVSYVGLCDLATMSGSVKWLQAKCVYSSDKFIDHGAGERPTHEYEAFAKKADRGEFVGVYCVAKTCDDDHLTTVMTAEEVDGIMQRSEAAKKNYGPWVTDFEEMAKKSVVRRAFKMLPKTDSLDRMALAVQVSNEAEGFEPIRTAPEVQGGFTGPQKEHFDYLISNQDAVGMTLFLRSIDDGAATDLFNSFEKGTITKYKQMVRDLDSKGRSQLEDCIIALNDAGATDDTHGAAEILDGMPDDAIDHFIQNCTPEASALIRSITSTQEES